MSNGGDRRSTERLLVLRGAAELLHGNAGALLQLAPLEPAGAAVFVDPLGDRARDGVFARLAAGGVGDVRVELCNRRLAAHAVWSDAREEAFDRAVADEVDGEPLARAASVLECLFVNA